MVLVRIEVKDVLDSNYAATREQAKPLATAISNALREEIQVELSFKDIEILAPNFLEELFYIIDVEGFREKRKSDIKFISTTKNQEETINEVTEFIDKYYNNNQGNKDNV